MARKSAAAKAAETKVEALVEEAVKVEKTEEKVEAPETAEVKAEDIVPAEAETVEAPKKRAGRKPAVKAEEKAPAEKKKPGRKPKAAAENVVAEKPAEGEKKPARKAPVRKAAVEMSVNLQFAGKSYSNEDLLKIAKDVWQYDLGRNEAELKTVELYVQPEESTVYYVFNGTETGNFGI